MPSAERNEVSYYNEIMQFVKAQIESNFSALVEYAKLIIRQAYSFYNLGNLIDMVMLCCPSLKIPLQGVGTQCWRHANRVSNGLRYPQLLTKSLKFSIHFILFPLLLEI